MLSKRWPIFNQPISTPVGVFVGAASAAKQMHHQMAKMPGARASPASRLMPLPQAIRHASADYMAPLFLHSGCVQWMEKAVDNCAQALCCNAFETAVNISPACRDAKRRFCRSGVSREADGPSDGIAAWCFGMVSFAAYAAPTSLRTEPPCGSCMSREADASSDGIAASRFGMVSFAAYAAPTSLRAELPCGSCVSREAEGSSDGRATWCLGMASFAVHAAPTGATVNKAFSTAAVCNDWRSLWTSAPSPCAARVSKS